MISVRAARVHCAALFACTLLSTVNRAWGDPATAEALFRQGRQLMSEGKTAAACEKFAASQREDPSSGTLLNLADCEAKEGKTASAWADFLAAGRMARNQGDAVRANEASRRVGELEPTLSRITIKLAERTPGLRLQRDEITLEDAALSSEIPIDPGEHVISAEAPGYRRWFETIRVGANGDRQEITVPPLEKAPAAPSAAGASSGAAAPAPAEPHPNSAAHRAPAGGYILGAAGIVAAGVGGVFGLKALSTYKDAESDCQGRHTQCPASSSTKYDTATTQANIANIGIGVGLVAIALGAYFVLHSPSSPPASATASRVLVVPWVEAAAFRGDSRSAAGGAITGRF